MIVIGLVGRIGAGKSTVAGWFAGHGARVLDADALAHEALAEPATVRALVERFGPEVLDDAGTVRRAALATRVFGPTAAHADNLRALEALVHPLVRARIDAALAAFRAAAHPPPAVVLDVPLLVQAGWDAACDLIVLVECAEPVRQDRLAARGWDETEQLAREAAWERRFSPVSLSPGKIRTVDTSGDLAYTRARVEDIWSELRRFRVPEGPRGDGDERSSRRGGRSDEA